MKTRRWSRRLVLVVALCGIVASPGRGQDDLSPEEQREQLVVERFAEVLERMPRRGTALDRVYGHHVERGTLDDLIASYRDRAGSDAGDGTAWMMLGLLEGQRGGDAEAAAAFAEAEAARPDDPLASYYLGQALVLVGRPDEAAGAFERAIARRPTRADLLEVYQALGRVHQRAGRTDEALAAWDRLEAQFPGDERVKEQIALTLVEEGEDELALPRLEALAEQAADPFRQVQYRVEAAEARVRMGQTAEALSAFEDLLGRLNPESWLHRDVRARIEDVFLRGDDLAGLAEYYERWIEGHPDDVDALARLGRTLASQGRAAEARERLEQAVELAPTNASLRLALIDQLVAVGEIDAVSEQYEALVEADPGDADAIRAWGRLLLDDASRPEDERKQAAAEVWRRLLDTRPDDPVTVAQVADLLRRAGLADEALALYRQAVELAPTEPQYREYLGEYFHSLKRPDEAIAAWQGIVAGANRTPENLGRLAEVLAGFGYDEPAVEAAADAISLDGDDFDLRVGLADLLHRLGRFDEARDQLDAADALADAPEQEDAVLERRIEVDQDAGVLDERIAEMRSALDADPDATAEDYIRLAYYLAARRDLPDAVAAARAAVDRDGASVRTWSAYAGLLEKSGDLGGAADAHRRIATLDRRVRADAMADVAKLEARLGRRDEALAAGREVIAASPSNSESYRFLAELCFQLGADEEGLDALRRASRVDPNDPDALLTLARALSERFRTEEAISLYWRAFEHAGDLEGRLAVVGSLAELYLQRNRFDLLVERLEQELRESDQRRELSLCKAQAYSSAGDLGSARQELELLLGASSRDTVLLEQLVKLTESESDFATAAEFQRQLVDLAPGAEAEEKLADLYLRSGQAAEAEAIWARSGITGREPHRIYQAIDRLLSQAKDDLVLPITERMLLQRPDDWEALFREGIARYHLGQHDEASRRFIAVLELDEVDDDAESALALERKARQNTLGRQAGVPAFGAVQQVQQIPIQQRVSSIYQSRRLLGLDADSYAYVSSSNTIRRQNLSPSDFGQARIGALGYLLAIERDRAEEGETDLADLSDALVSRLHEDEEGPGAIDALWDRYILAQFRNDLADALALGEQLSRHPGSGPEAAFLYLSSLATRATAGAAGGQVVIQQPQPGAEPAELPPLPDDELEHAIGCYDRLREQAPDWVTTPITRTVLTELERAGRDGEAAAIYERMVAEAKAPDELAGVLQLAADRGDTDELLELLEEYERLDGNGPSRGGSPLAPLASSMAQAMAVLAKEDDLDGVLSLLDRYLDAQAEHAGSARGRRPSSSRTPSYGPSGYVQVHVGSPSSSYTRLDFPQPNQYLDYGAIQLLRNAFEAFRLADRASDLRAHLHARFDEAPEADRVAEALGLCGLHWWEGDQDEAIAWFRRAVDGVSDPELTLSMAELHMRRGERDEALALVESVEPLDQGAMQRREVMALELSVQLGDVDRAREAAERLFGLRLSTDLQVLLARQMHQLGMHELAEAVLARARRRAGNQSSSMLALMQQYQRQEQIETAVQIAHQILRRSRGVSAYTSSRTVSSANDSGARQAALQLLSRSGRLGDLIARAEAQLETSPESSQVLQTLSDYYQAAGDREKSLEIMRRLADSRSGDADQQYNLAMALVNANKAEEAIDYFKRAVKAQPRLFGQRFYEMQRAFQGAGKLDELVALLGEIDLRQVGQYYYLSQLIEQLARDEETRDAAVQLMRRVWEAFPDERASIIGNVSRSIGESFPELYEYSVDAIIPSPDQKRVVMWNATVASLGWYSDGRILGLLPQLLDMASSQSKLDELAAELEAANERLPEWDEGRVILGLVRARQGRYDEAHALIEPVFFGDDGSYPTGYAPQVIGSELSEFAELRDLAIRIFEESLDAPGSRNNQFTFSPARLLCNLYQRDGRDEEAREMLLRHADLVRSGEGINSSDPDYESQRKAADFEAIGDELLESGDPLTAVLLFGEALSEAETPTAGGPNQSYYGQQKQQLADRSQQKLDRAVSDLDPEALSRTLGRLMEPAEDASEGGPALDLVLLVVPRDLERAGVMSLFSRAVEAASDGDGLPEGPREALSRLVAERPDDFSVQIAAALVAFAQGEDRAIEAAVDRLTGLLDRAPLESLAEGEAPNARQRDEAEQQIALWLVARRCWGRDGMAEVGDRLAERALSAAGRLVEPLWSLAMLREWGQALLDRGDRDGAERRWARMLNLILDDPARGPGDATDVSALPARRRIQLVSQERATRPPAPARGDGTAPRVPPLSLDRFRRAMQVARLAAGHEMHALSLRAVSESLAGGPPIADSGPGQSMMATLSGGASIRSMVVTSPGGAEPIDPGLAAVEEQLRGLDSAWLTNEAPAAEVYATLRDAVMPGARPDQIFLYARPLAETGDGPPQSVGALLVAWADRAGATDDLRSRLDARAEGVAAVPAGVLQILLARGVGDHEAAARALRTLADRVRADGLESTAEAACHAALPGLEDESTRDEAVAVIDAAVGALARPNDTSDQPLSGLYSRMARAHYRAGDPETGRQSLEAFLVAMEAKLTRYDADSAISRRSRFLNNVAREAIELEDRAFAMDLLGRLADAPTTRFSAPSGDTLIVPIARLLAADEPANRYRLLKDWTFPTENRRSLRLLASFSPSETPPERFRPPGVEPSADRAQSTAGLLLDAAQAAGTLDELTGELERLSAEGVENAETLRTLALIRAGSAEATREHLATLRDAMQARAADEQDRQEAPEWDELLVARACLADPELRSEFGRPMVDALITRAQHSQSSQILGHLRRDRAEAIVATVEAEAEAEGNLDTESLLDGDPGLAHWTPISFESSSDRAAGNAAPLWAALDGHIAHLAGPARQELVLNYPLAGTFEISLDAYGGESAEADLSFAGLRYSPLLPDNTSGVSAISGNGSLRRANPFDRRDAFNRITLKVSPDSVTCLVNGHLYFEDKSPGRTSPWIALSCMRDRATFFRDVRITGDVAIPREVPLVSGDRLDGWIPNDYYDSLPERPLPMAPDQEPSSREISWSARDGEIEGALVDNRNIDVWQSRIYYTRPLLAGETFSYEFFYEPDRTVVHPTVGRVALLVEPGGVREHWLSDLYYSNEDDWAGINADNAIDLPDRRRGGDNFPLNPGDWNAVSLTHDGETATLTLNGQTVYEYPLDGDHTPEFGFYRNRARTSSRIRNAVLRGDWPDRLPDDLLALAPGVDHGEAGRRALRRLIGEDLLADAAFDVVREARALGPEEQFEALTAWVLPDADHPTLRLAGAFTPTDPPPPTTLETSPTGDGVRMVRSGGEVVAPAIELATVARTLGRLDELRGRVDSLEPKDDGDRRARHAMLALLAVEAEDDEAATEHLVALRPLLESLPPDAPRLDLWPALVAARRGIDRSGSRGPAMALLDHMVVDRIPERPQDATWEAQIRNVRARGQVLGLEGAGPFGSQPVDSPWTGVVLGHSMSRGQGRPVPHWVASDGGVVHHPGHDRDEAILGVPLLGDFEVRCRLSALDRGEGGLAYGGIGLGLHHERAKLERFRSGRPAGDVPLDPPFAAVEIGDEYDYRLVVRDGTLAAYINDRKVHEEPLPDRPDPWLTVFGPTDVTGGVRDLEIVGDPTIPEELSLSHLADLTGWAPYGLHDTVEGADADWTRRGDEIVGRGPSPVPPSADRSVMPTPEQHDGLVRIALPGSAYESMLRYRRPMAEDGAISYEFYHLPGRTLVHPALDRLVFLLADDGVRIHWMTDGAYDRTGLDPGNEAVEPSCRRGPAALPLKERDWNRLTLAVEADTVRLTLNDTLIYERPVEPTNQRLFGLFHFADLTEARVRNVTYRGAWPRVLPAELTDQGDGRASDER